MYIRNVWQKFIMVDLIVDFVQDKNSIQKFKCFTFIFLAQLFYNYCCASVRYLWNLLLYCLLVNTLVDAFIISYIAKEDLIGSEVSDILRYRQTEPFCFFNIFYFLIIIVWCFQYFFLYFDAIVITVLLITKHSACSD